MPMTAAVEVERPPKVMFGVLPPEEAMGKVPVTEVTALAPEKIHTPLREKQPPVRLMPLAAVEEAVVEVAKKISKEV